MFDDGVGAFMEVHQRYREHLAIILISSKELSGILKHIVVGVLAIHAAAHMGVGALPLRNAIQGVNNLRVTGNADAIMVSRGIYHKLV